jgi:hypothetical protein
MMVFVVALEDAELLCMVISDICTGTITYPTSDAPANTLLSASREGAQHGHGYEHGLGYAAKTWTPGTAMDIQLGMEK